MSLSVVLDVSITPTLPADSLPPFEFVDSVLRCVLVPITAVGDTGPEPAVLFQVCNWFKVSKGTYTVAIGALRPDVVDGQALGDGTDPQLIGESVGANLDYFLVFAVCEASVTISLYLAGPQPAGWGDLDHLDEPLFERQPAWRDRPCSQGVSVLVVALVVATAPPETSDSLVTPVDAACSRHAATLPNVDVG